MTHLIRLTAFGVLLLAIGIAVVSIRDASHRQARLPLSPDRAELESIGSVEPFEPEPLGEELEAPSGNVAGTQQEQ